MICFDLACDVLFAEGQKNSPWSWFANHLKGTDASYERDAISWLNHHGMLYVVTFEKSNVLLRNFNPTAEETWHDTKAHRYFFYLEIDDDADAALFRLHHPEIVSKKAS